MANTPKVERLDLQETEAVIDRINFLRKTLEKGGHAGYSFTHEEVIVSLGAFVLERADKIIASLEYAAYGEDADD